MRALALAPVFFLLASCLTTAKQDLTTVGAGQYGLEKAHGSIVWRIKHQGLSWYTGRLTDFDAQLDFDPKNPAASKVKAVINPLSVSAEHPTDKDWNRRIGEDFFKGKSFPQIVFTSTKIEPTGAFTGKVTGDLSFAGVTKPVTLDVIYNGSARSPFYGTRDMVGFSAHTTFKRSDFGVTNYASIGSDVVEIIIEAEFVHAP